MKLSRAVDDFLGDKRSQGRINSPNTEAAYRRVLAIHDDDVEGRDPSKTGRADVKKTLRHWMHPNSQRQAHAILTSFYDWCMEEGIRNTNPARMVARAKPRAKHVYRPTRGEVVALLDASTEMGRRERWVVHLGVLAGLRRAELVGLQGRHLARPGFVWVSADIGKGGRERWMPVLAELEPVVAEIQALVANDQWVTPSRKPGDRAHTLYVDRTERPISPTGLYKMVKRVGAAASLAADIGPHTLRHAYGDHVARYAGLRAAQALMGHVNVETTASSYTERPTLDELAVSVAGFSYRRVSPAQTPRQPQSGPDAH